MRTLSDLGALQGKTVLLRADLNVPLKDGKITDDGRVRAALGTINELRESGAKIVVISHLGRPAGKVVDGLSLTPVAQRLTELLEVDVRFVADTVGQQAQEAVAELTEGDVLVLENLRFNAAETSKNAQERAEFAAQLAALADVFVLDGFGVVHREQASVTDVARLLPAAAGRLVATEVEMLKKLIDEPERPYIVVLGGSKVSDKLGVIDRLLDSVDTLLIGGGMVFTFLKAKGYDVAASLLESDQLDTVREYLSRAAEKGVEIVLPSDIVVAQRFAADSPFAVVSSAKIAESKFGDNGIGLDIGPESARDFAERIVAAKTVFWNGPMGVFEMPAFSLGTKTVAQALTKVQGVAVVGGGDSAAAVREFGFSDADFTHISTGGGASLEFLEGKKLPGLEEIA
ncbi:phosphoglycerate kinase [Canibacter sp. lx-72]|uniref:phosphoglycerate kinase n=1 Tax=Canibacter zhuwentaonis TaxID=2837491 RepID=UPI001BDD4039|nr:phosphoglycerate kinase [Canibacter zhuwentaonis]MBT1018497.1 phosphoglycerate kinase [Canibacter zhuwentaonis]